MQLLICSVAEDTVFQAPELISIEAWTARKDPYRVVAVGSPRPLPLRRTIASADITDIYENKVIDRIAPILARHQIESDLFGMDRRIDWDVSDDSLVKLDTFFVETSNEDPRAFKAAAMEIFRLFQEAGKQADTIEVEICNSTLTAALNHSFPVLDDQIVNAIDNAKYTILKVVKKFCSTAWTSIAFHMRGKKQPDSTCYPTVLVKCGYGSQCDFCGLELALLAILASTGWRLEILPGVLEMATGINRPLYIASDFPESPPNGSSIGLKGNKDQAGTLGCWLRLHLPNGQTLPVILTCSHVLFSKETPAQAKISRDGMRLDEFLGKFEATYPAVYDLDWNIKRLDNAINSRTLDSSEIQLYRQLHRLRHTSVGTVIAASGIRKNADDRRVDWALIRSSESNMRNHVPSKYEVKQEHYQIPDGTKVRSHAEVSMGDWVVKQGRTTGTTTGRVSKMRRFVPWPEHGIHSSEIEIFGETEDFALSADSGSMVTDINGALVGILFGNETRVLNFNVGFITPFKDLVDDVKHYTTGTLSL